MTEQLAIDFETGRPLTETEGRVLRAIRCCRGRDNAVSVGRLVLGVFSLFTYEGAYATREREVRRIVKHLVEVHGIPIASCSAGYYVPVTAEETERACRQYHRAAMSHLKREARLRRVSLPDLLGQMRLEVEG